MRFLDLIKFGHICIFGRLKFCKLAPAFFHREHLLTNIESGAQLQLRPEKRDLIWNLGKSECGHSSDVCVHVVPMLCPWGKLFPVKIMIQDIE